MKLSGYMKLEAEPIKLRSLTRSLNSQQHKQLVFQIGETLESRPSLLRKIKVEPLEEDGLGERPKPLHVEEEWTGPSSTSEQKPSLNNHTLPAARLLPISVKLTPSDSSPPHSDSLTHIPVEPSNNNIPSSINKHPPPIDRLPTPTDQPLPHLAPTEKHKLRSNRLRTHTRRLSAQREKLPLPVDKLPSPTDKSSPSDTVPHPTTDKVLPSTDAVDKPLPRSDRLSSPKDKPTSPSDKHQQPSLEDKLPSTSDKLLPSVDELSPSLNKSQPILDKLSPSPGKPTLNKPPSEEPPTPSENLLTPADKCSPSPDKLSTSPDNKLSPSPDKVSPSPDKLPSSPDKLLSSPDKLSTSPDKLSTSPDKLSTSPDDKLSPSPDKLSTSLDKLSSSPDKLSTSPDKLSSSPDKHSFSPDKLSPSPDKLSSSPDKLSSSPDKLSSSPDRLSPSPDKLSSSPDKLSPSPDKPSSSPDKLSPSPDKLPSSPDKLPSSPDKLPSSPGKLPSSPDKLPSSPGKLPSSPDKLQLPSDKPPPSPDKFSHISEHTSSVNKFPPPSEKSPTSEKFPSPSEKLPFPEKLPFLSPKRRPSLDKSPSPDKFQISKHKPAAPSKVRSPTNKLNPSDKYTFKTPPSSPDKFITSSDTLLPSLDKLSAYCNILPSPCDKLPLSSGEYLPPVGISPLSNSLSPPTVTFTTSSDNPEPVTCPTLPSCIAQKETSLNVPCPSSVASVGESAIANTNIKLECIDPQPDMVRLIQEPDSRIDSFCRKRSSRVAKRVSSVDITEHLDLKNEFGGARATRSCRSRRTSSRSDRSESEVSDSRSLAEETVHFDMVDKSGSKRGRPKNGEPPFEEANHHSTAAAAKCNGEMSTETLNGVAKVKGRRISRTNSDESDASNGSKSNGLDHNGDKVDFSVLLEISVADRKKFEQKKSKRRRKTADWLLISETEQYYNEKEEIMRNKNKHDSDSDSDDSDEENDRVVCKSEPQSESDSKHSDDSEVSALHVKRKKKRGPKNNRKHSGAADDGDDEEEPVTYKDKVSVRETEDDVVKNAVGRGKGGRHRKTLYDLTMLNVNEDDDDDDDNFFGFPVSTTITASGTTGMSSSSHTHSSNTRSKSRNGKTKKRLSEAERFLRDNKEYYHFQETEERLRRTSHTDKSPDKTPDEKHSGRDAAIEKELRETRRKGKYLKGDICGRSLRSRTVEITKEGKDEKKESKEEEEKEEDFSEKEEEKVEDIDTKKVDTNEIEKEVIIKSENVDKDIKVEENIGKLKIPKEESDVNHKELFCKEHIENSESPSDASIKDRRSSDDSEATDSSTRDSMTKTVDEMYFSFEGVPESESWYQTYQRFIDGIAVNEFVYDDDPLRFVLPYEMPRDVMKEIICRKSLASKKKNDLSDLVRKSPRCHASTLALFSDILPPKRVKTVKVTRSTKVEEVSSDGTSTSGTDSTHPQSVDFSESFEEFAIIAHHMDLVMLDGKEDLEGLHSSIEASKETEHFEDTDHKKSVPRKRGKKKRLSKEEKDSELSMPVECKVFDNPLACEIDPQVLLSLGEDVKDLVPLNVLTQDPSEVVEDSWKCECTELISCDELSSIDDNTEASSECFSLCDSETVDGSVTSENRGRGGRTSKKRRVNLTGWPKTQKRKRSQPCRDETDGVLEDQQPKKRGKCQKNKDNHSLLDPLLSEDLSAMASETERRASPRKKATVLYTDHFPLRVRTCK
ncbi:uncharacterized protein LOC143020013 [Oratosquilla oratoria]|uniref:uncharacterized protein LOC143020013 n=1 Tax=Oratosquilla oratoria TaxID=337810 RepID=UPI003F7761FC